MEYTNLNNTNRNKAIKTASNIFRVHRPKTMSDIFEIARFQYGNGISQIEGVECENEYGWLIVDAHYANLDDPVYRATAGLPIR